MGQILSKSLLTLLTLIITTSLFAQNEGATTPVYSDYKNDTTFSNFHKLRGDVARAQILSLKTNGALLVRLKTNSNTIQKLKTAGNIDLATQVERETALKNKIIVASYLQEFTFCPVYFFYSDCSDSVKHKSLTNIFVDTSLTVNPNIVCNATYYLIAESGSVKNSSLGLVPESFANSAVEKGDGVREAAIVIKNRYFIQLHKPFPYFQIKSSVGTNSKNPYAGLSLYLESLYHKLNVLRVGVVESKDMIRLKGSIFLLNRHFEEFYEENKAFIINPELMKFIY